MGQYALEAQQAALDAAKNRNSTPAAQYEIKPNRIRSGVWSDWLHGRAHNNQTSTHSTALYQSALTHARTQARKRAQYSKRCNGLINNASPLHVYARPGQDRPTDAGGETRRTMSTYRLKKKPITERASTSKFKSLPPVEKEMKILSSSVHTC